MRLDHNPFYDYTVMLRRHINSKTLFVSFHQATAQEESEWQKSHNRQPDNLHLIRVEEQRLMLASPIGKRKEKKLYLELERDEDPGRRLMLYESQIKREIARMYNGNIFKQWALLKPKLSLKIKYTPLMV